MIRAELVYDGGRVIVPSEMGTPLSNQLRGYPLENLGEVASRICYDSLGVDKDGKPRGRSTELLHAHIKEVINLSVYEHGNFTIEFMVGDDWNIISTFMNRKGVWLEKTPDGFRATVNFRTILEWKRHTKRFNDNFCTHEVGRILYQHARLIAPIIFNEPQTGLSHWWEKTKLVEDDLNEDEIWISLYLAGSRGWSHEMVRHRFAMSQRSTRYVDENGSPYIMHPLVVKFLEDESVDKDLRHELRNRIDTSISADRMTYVKLVEALQDYTTKTMGLDKQTARKQGRGASRGYLGNGLKTEMIYSAPISGWWWILNQRLSKFADAEIRDVIGEALPILKSCRHGKWFEAFDLVPGSDGLAPMLQEVLMPTPSLAPPTW